MFKVLTDTIIFLSNLKRIVMTFLCTTTFPGCNWRVPTFLRTTTYPRVSLTSSRTQICREYNCRQYQSIRMRFHSDVSLLTRVSTWFKLPPDVSKAALEQYDPTGLLERQQSNKSFRFRNFSGVSTSVCLGWTPMAIPHGFLTGSISDWLFRVLRPAQEYFTEGLQNLGLCWAFRAFEHGGIFIVPHLLWYGALVFSVWSEGTPHLVASYDTRRDAEDLF
jgi:hypothetical protein